MQLDIFEHSREVMLRNDVVQALERFDAVAARLACERLTGEYPQDDLLPPSLVLVAAVEATGQQNSFLDHEALGRARKVLLEVIQPAVQRVLGDRTAFAWLSRLWQDLARRAAPLNFNALFADDHAAALWLRAGDWQAAAQAVMTIESWRRIPAPLAWMVEARLHLVGLQATWPMLAELGWLSPQRLADVAPRSQDPLLLQLLRRFEASFEGAGDVSDLAWFAAWVLTQHPQLSAHLGAAQVSQHTAAEQAMRLLVEILRLERQGRHHDIVARRKALRDLHPSLYAAYMKTR